MGKAVGLSPVPTVLVPNALPQVAAKLRAVYAKVPFWMPLQTLVEQLLEGKMQLWLLIEHDVIVAMFCTRICDNFGVKMAEIVLYSGEMNEDIMEHLPEVEAWAREHGAQGMRFEGRSGWPRLLKKYGYSLEHVAMFKLLETKVS